MFHPMDQFLVKPLFGEGAVAWYTPTNVTLWMAVTVLAILNQLVTRKVQVEAMRNAGEAEQRGQVMRREIDTLRGLGMRSTIANRWAGSRAAALAAQMRASDRGGALTITTKTFRMLVQSAILALLVRVPAPPLILVHFGTSCVPSVPGRESRETHSRLR